MPEDSEPKSLIAHLTDSCKTPEDQERAAAHLSSFLKDEKLPMQWSCRARWVHALWLLAAACFLFVVYQANQDRLAAKSITSMSDAENTPFIPAIQTDSLSDEDRWMLGHGYTKDERPARELHRADPDNPLYFRMHAAEHLYDSGLLESSLPENFLETAERIDPGNAYFLLVEAGFLIGDSLEIEDLVDIDPELRRVGKGIRRGVPQRYEPTDPEAFEQALTLIEKASGRARLQNYQHEQVRQIAEIYDRVGRKESWPGFMMSLLPWISNPTMLAQFNRMQKVLSAAGYQAYVDKDQERLLEVVAMREALARLSGASTDQGIIRALVYAAFAQNTAIDLAHYCEQLGLKAEAQRLSGQADALLQRRLTAKEQSSFSQDDEILSRMAIIHLLMLPAVRSMVVEPPEFGEEQAKPLRLAEHDFGCGSLMRAGVLFFLLSAGALMLSYRRMSRGVHHGARQAVNCLKTGDWLCVIILGLILPLVGHALLMRLTPLGGRDFGVSRFAFIYPVVPTSCLSVLQLLISAAVLRWRLIHRLPFQDKPGAWPLLTWVLVGANLLLPLLMYLLFQKLYPQNPSQIWGPTFYFVWFLPLATLLLAGAVALWRGFGKRGRERFITIGTAHGLTRVLPVGIIACLVASVGWRMSESHWIRQESTLRLTARKPNLGIYEHRLAEQLFKEVNAIVFPEEE